MNVNKLNSAKRSNLIGVEGKQPVSYQLPCKLRKNEWSLVVLILHPNLILHHHHVDGTNTAWTNGTIFAKLLFLGKVILGHKLDKKSRSVSQSEVSAPH